MTFRVIAATNLILKSVREIGSNRQDMKLVCLIFVIFTFVAIEATKRKKCFEVTDPPTPECPHGEIYMEKGPGPFCYQFLW